MTHYLSQGAYSIRYDEEINEALVIKQFHSGAADLYQFTHYKSFIPNKKYPTEKELFAACTKSKEGFFNQSMAKVLQEALFNLDDTYRPFLLQIKELLDKQKEFFKTKDKTLLAHCKKHEALLYEQLELMLKGNPV